MRRSSIVGAFSTAKFNDLNTMQNELDGMLVSGIISIDDYDQEWSEILDLLGWTEEEYAEEVDRRWDD